MQNKYSLILIILYFGMEIIALGQTESQIIPTEKKQLTIVTEPSSLYKGFFRAGIVGTYFVVDKYFDNYGNRNYFPESTWARSYGLNLIAQYGITDRLQFDLMLPYQNEAWYYSQFLTAPGLETDMDQSWDLRGNGLSDMSMYLRYQIIQEKETFPSITGEIGITLPTGRESPTDIKDDYDYKLSTGTGEASTNVRLLARKIVYPYSFKFYVDYTYNMGGTKLFNSFDTEELSFKSGSRIAFGGSADILLNEWIALTNELNYFSNGKDEINEVVKETSSSGLSYEGRLVFQIKQFRIGEAVNLPLKAKNTGADPLYVMIIQYVF